MTTKTYVTEDWQRDALRLVMVDHDTNRLARLVEGPGHPPVFRMDGYAPGEVTRDHADEAGLLLPLTVAREVYEALRRHFGEDTAPGSRELVDVLKDVHSREAERVDLLVGRLTAGLAFPHGGGA